MEMDFRLLGPFSISRARRVLPITAGKQRVILALLLLRHNQIVSADELIDSLWGERPPASAQATLQNYVKRLRRAFEYFGERRIQTASPGYIIEIDGDELDVTRFERWSRRGSDAARACAWDEAARSLRTALDQWRGDPFIDVPCEKLALEVAPRFAEARLNVHEAWIDAQLFLGRHAEVIFTLRQLTMEYPLREKFHEQLMLALYRNRQRDAALAAYRNARKVLVREIGLEPGPELQHLHQNLLEGRAVVAAGPFDRLPEKRRAGAALL